MRKISALAILVMLTACSESDQTVESETTQAQAPDAQAQAQAQAATESASGGFTQAEIDAAAEAMDADDLAKHVQVLASDEFGGRAPFTEGEEKTLSYLEDAFKKIGAMPANGDSYRQQVELVELSAEPGFSLDIDAGDEQMSLAFGDDMMGWTKRVTESISIADSPMVFVGYGINAPEFGWNDYEGLDVAGKTVLIMVNDPGYATQDDELFTGNAMTYYGRWTYKYEEAARQGATAAIVIHETGAAGYPWEVVSGSWAGAQFDLAAENDNMHRVEFEGWITQDAAKQLFSASGHDYDALAQAAATREFEAVPLDATASVALSNTIRRSQSANIAAMIEGSERPDEVFVYMGHWDHLGTQDGEGDQIFNGAVDNATGTAALLEMAEAFKALPQAPKRSILFLAVTAEESGLLGSAYYAANPLFPIEDTVGGVNIDAMNVYGPVNDMVVVGYGSSELEDILREKAKSQGRTLVQEPTPEKGYFFRSDHFNFAKQGVPVLYAEGGTEHREKGAEYLAEKAADYTANRYHKPGDEYSEDWDLRGAVDDMRLYFAVGLEVAQSDSWPNWYEGNAFKAARDEAMAKREQ